MGSLLADNEKNGKVRITQFSGMPGNRTIAGIDHLLLILPDKVPAALWRKIPHGSKVQALMRRKAPAQVPAISTRIDNDRQTALHVGTINANASAFETLTFGRKMVASALSETAGTLGIWVLGFTQSEQSSISSRMAAAALAAAWSLPTFKSEPQTERIKSIKIVGLDKEIDLRREQAEAEANNFAR